MVKSAHLLRESANELLTCIVPLLICTLVPFAGAKLHRYVTQHALRRTPLHHAVSPIALFGMCVLNLFLREVFMLRLAIKCISTSMGTVKNTLDKIP